MTNARAAEYLQGLFGLEGLNAVVIGGEGVLGGSFCETLAAAGAYTVVAGINAENGETCVKRIRDAG
ncbi:MAG TPA: gluconate 5-dehydrogenase, partial [Planctomycetaceae bacterium]|nr:gluconate 5-dehydrogenase [Planctomycetaceae bacterium]